MGTQFVDLIIILKLFIFRYTFLVVHYEVPKIRGYSSCVHQFKFLFWDWLPIALHESEFAQLALWKTGLFRSCNIFRGASTRKAGLQLPAKLVVSLPMRCAALHFRLHFSTQFFFAVSAGGSSKQGPIPGDNCRSFTGFQIRLASVSSPTHEILRG